jgi:hypothetical protein
MHLVVCVHVAMPVLGDHRGRSGPLTFRAQHGRRDRAPDGEQNGQHDQNEDAEVFHFGKV